jgi:hypothetical protein
MEMVANAELITETGEVFSLLYYVVHRERYFGIRAEKLCENCLLEWDCIQYLFESKDDAERLIKLLAKNTVTPFSMCEVVDELLDMVCSMPKAV